MHYENFLDNLLPDRVYLIKEYGDPTHIHQLLCKYLHTDLEDSKKRFEIKIDNLRGEVSFKGNGSDLNKLSTIAIRKRVTIVSFSEYGLILKLDDFINKII